MIPHIYQSTCHQRAFRIPGIVGAGDDIVCDLFDSENKFRQRGAVIFLHGGGFVGGSRDQFLAAASWLSLTTGALCITVDYKTAEVAPYPAAVVDCLAVFQWVWDRREQYRIDAEQVVVVGGSPGANIGAMAMMADETWFIRYGIENNNLFQPQNGIFLNGIYHLADFYDRNEQEQKNVQLYLGGETIDRTLLEETSYSRWNMRRKNILLLHGDQDQIIQPSQCFAMKSKAEADGGRLQVVFFEGMMHAWFNEPEYLYPVLICIRNFMDTIRKEVEQDGTS